MGKKKYKIITKSGNPPSSWLKKQFEEHDPISTTREVLQVLQNETAAVGLFKAIAGLGQIAHGKGDEAGFDSCCEALRILDLVRLNIKMITEDYDRELKKPGSSFR